MFDTQSSPEFRFRTDVPSGLTVAFALVPEVVALASPLIEMVPVAAPVGVMFMVVLGAFEWSSVRVMTKVPVSDAVVIVLVSTVTVATELALGKHLHLRHLSPECRKLLRKAGNLVEVDVVEDPRYHVATDALD